MLLAALFAASVTIDSGPVVGREVGSAAVFRSIPYAAPPVGPLRWKPPGPVKRWSAPFKADGAPGPACIQPLAPAGVTNAGGYAGPISEDCLTLDVTAPWPLAKGAPVLVWIPGGGNFAGGANVPSYDARNFARDGVIVVTMNYRLGALGFFAHPALGKHVNYGLLDQIAALKWVKRNISAFGGDPRRVTLSGESAGGGDTLALMTLSAARGLFHQAIVQSGGGWEEPATFAARQAEGVALATRLGASTAEELRALPADKLATSGGGITIDGRLLAEAPVKAFAAGRVVDVPLMIGSNSNEASLMGLGVSAPSGAEAAYADLPTDAEKKRQMFNDAVMGAPARWIAARTSSGAPSFLYYFSYVPERQRQTRPGTNHASEIPFVFDSLDAVPGRTPLITPSERAAAALAHSCWVGFIKTGAPRCAGQDWPAYHPKTDQLLEIGIDSGVRTHFRKRQLDAQEAAARR